MEYSANPETVVKGRCSRSQIHNPQGASRQECKGAQANRRSDASKAIVIGLSPKLAPEKRASAKKG